MAACPIFWGSAQKVWNEKAKNDQNLIENVETAQNLLGSHHPLPSPDLPTRWRRSPPSPLWFQHPSSSPRFDKKKPTDSGCHASNVTDSATVRPASVLLSFQAFADLLLVPLIILHLGRGHCAVFYQTLESRHCLFVCTYLYIQCIYIYLSIYLYMYILHHISSLSYINIS